MTLVRRSLTAVAIAGAVTAGAALPASASPVFTGGLVNVTITNALNNNNLLNNNQVVVTVPIQATAAICGVQVSLLTTAFTNNAPVTCDPRNGNQTVTVTKA